MKAISINLDKIQVAAFAAVLWLGLWCVYRFAGLDWFVFVVSFVVVVGLVRDEYYR